MTERELAAALLDLGDETDAPAIAALIVQRRAEQPITTTDQLSAIICQARDFTPKRAAGAKLHPAARTFQALRILTNRELANLDRLLAILPTVLHPNGTAAIISFHSGEDRRVKAAFKRRPRHRHLLRHLPRPPPRRRARTEPKPPLPLRQTPLGPAFSGLTPINQSPPLRPTPKPLEKHLPNHDDTFYHSPIAPPPYARYRR